jgi:hypothetical protein
VRLLARPCELGSAADVEASDAALLAAYAAEPVAEWDCFLPDCVLDPAVHAAGLDRLSGRYGVATDGPTSVLSLSLSVADLGCDAVLNGCSAVDVRAPTGGPAVVDPTAPASTRSASAA